MNIKPNTEVKFRGVVANVIEDKGDSLRVEANGVEMEWKKEFEGEKVEVLVEEKVEKPEIPFHLQGAFNSINSLRGRIGTMTYQKDISKVKKKHEKLLEGKKLQKRSIFQVRAGIEYNNIKAVKEKHENGERERKGLPDSMMKIDTGIYYHLFKEQFYVGCAPVHNENSVRKSEFLLDGEVVGLDHELDDGVILEDVLMASDKKSSSGSDWLTLPIENVKGLSGITE